MKLARRTAAVTTIAIIVSGSALALAGPASAAESVGPVAKYNGACGAGHKVIDSADMENLGTTFLTYNKTTGENCVVTVRASAGTAVYMFASLSSKERGRRPTAASSRPTPGPFTFTPADSASPGKAASPPIPRGVPVTAADPLTAIRFERPRGSSPDDPGAGPTAFTEPLPLIDLGSPVYSPVWGT